MTNLHNIFKLYNVQSHNQNLVRDLLTKHLPSSYTSKIKELVADQHPDISSQTIRDVKCGRVKDIIVYEALITLAQSQYKIEQRVNNKLKQAV